MDRSYILDSYINENEENKVRTLEATELLDNFEFRIRGSKTISEIKKEMDIFYEQNNIPYEVKDEMDQIINEFNDTTDVYTACNRLENVLSTYLESKEKEFQKSDETVYEIKEEVVETAIKDLEEVGITTTGDNADLIDKIESEADVIKLQENVETTVEYFNDRNNVIGEENAIGIELSTTNLDESLEKSGTDTILETSLEEQQSTLDTATVTNVDALDDGSISIQGDGRNNESLNFTAMMTVALLGTNSDFGINESLDMKLIKGDADISSYKVIYGNFPLTNHPENKLDPVIVDRIQRLAKNYNPNYSYMNLLSQTLPEVSTSLAIINNHILNEPGKFQMAVRNNDGKSDIVFAMDENYSVVSESFRESGAMISSDAAENNIVKVNNTTAGEKLMLLTATLENLDSKKQLKTESNMLENSYQKKKVYEPPINENANTFNIFLITIVAFEVAIMLIGFFVIFK